MGPATFRPPYGYLSGATMMSAAGLHLPILLWDQEFNRQGESAASNAARLGNAVQPGSIVLGHDAHCYAEWNHEDDPFRALEHWHYRHLPTEVLPLLQEAGVSEAELDRMLVSNPARLLQRGAPY